MKTLDTATETLDTAKRLITGDRRDDYGDPAENFEHIARTWSIVLGVPVTKRQVALCMVGMKLCREAANPKLDNLVDLAGYAALASGLPHLSPDMLARIKDVERHEKELQRW